MKTDALFQYSNFALRVADEAKPPIEKTQLRVVEKTEPTKKPFGFIENKAINDCTSWDASWFANYE